MATYGYIEHVYKSWFWAKLEWWDQSTTSNIANRTTRIHYKFTFRRDTYTPSTRTYKITFGNQPPITGTASVKNSGDSAVTMTIKEGDIDLPNTVSNGIGVCNFTYSFWLDVNATLSGKKVNCLESSGTGTAERQYYNPNGRVINEFKTFRVDSEGSSSESNAGEVVYSQIRLSGGVQANCSVNIYYRQTSVPTTTTYDGMVTLTSAQLASALSSSGLSGTAVFTGKKFSKEYAYHFLLEFAEKIPDSTGYYESETAKASIPKSSMVMHLAGNPSGGVAFGQFSTSTQDNPKFECNYPATFYQGINVSGTEGAALRNAIRDIVYPIGAIYISTKATNPNSWLGGTWVQITDKFLVARGSTYTSTGGAASYNLSVGHKHLSPIGYAGNLMGFAEINESTEGGTGELYRSVNADHAGSSSPTINLAYTANATISATIPTVPPYKAVYVWERTA